MLRERRLILIKQLKLLLMTGNNHQVFSFFVLFMLDSLTRFVNNMYVCVVCETS